MSEHSRFVAGSIEEFLVSLAQGVQEAQNALSSLPAVDDFGRPLPTYHLPYLDFDLQVDMETHVDEQGRPVLRVLPLTRTIARAGGADTQQGTRSVASTTSSKTTQQRTHSRISGRLVAAPPGEGLPLPRLDLSVEGEARDRELRIQLSASNSAGEYLAGQQVELNIDVAASVALSASQAGGSPEEGDLRAQLSEALLVTDEMGQAGTTLTLQTGNKLPLLLLVATMGTAQATTAVDLT